MTRAISVACLFAALAAPAGAQVTRVSVSTAGVEANGPSGPPSISGDGRYVVFASAATNLVATDTNGVADIFLRDRDTDTDGIFDEVGAVATTRISVGPSAAQADGASSAPTITPDGRFVAFVSTATNLLAGATSASQVYRLDRTTNALIRVSESAAGVAGDENSDSPAITANGDVVAFRSTARTLVTDAGSDLPHIFVREVTADLTTRLTPLETGEAFSAHSYGPPSISSSGTRVAFIGVRQTTPAPFAFVADRTSGVQRTLADDLPLNIALSQSGLLAVVHRVAGIARTVIDSGAMTPTLTAPAGIPSVTGVSPGTRYALTDGAQLHDFDLGVSQSLGFVPGGARFSADDRWLAAVTGTSTLLPGNADTNGVDDAFVIDLPDFLDADNDTMDDRWETIFGVTDPAADPDADGQTNAQEEDAGTHPNGQVRRFLAEGATGSFFHTSIALANPNPTLAASVVLTFDRGNGTRVRRSIAIPAGRSAVVDTGAVAGLDFSEVSTTVESDRVLGVERSMTWGVAGGSIYGSHAETSTAAPSPTWFLAEGSTVLGFDLFYLLQNPQTTVAHTTVRFLLPDGTVVSRTYDLAPGSRTTIYVNEVAGLGETDVSGDISADVPIVVERAMYRGSPGQPFALGTDSMGVTAAAPSWFLAEGATGTFFDLYVLIANPGNTDATVQAQVPAARRQHRAADLRRPGAQPVQRLRRRHPRPRVDVGRDDADVQRADRGRARHVLAERVLRVLRGPQLGGEHRDVAELGGRRR